MKISIIIYWDFHQYISASLLGMTAIKVCHPDKPKSQDAFLKF
ncbi:hypothetical protein CHCC15087_3889 [Bacillus licheniformis]|nr:hypothetical protein CHCC15087_3889 [Bacillus licheniformis]